ncbi:GatB/YqeY domain-containing protein [Anaerolineales bacterium]
MAEIKAEMMLALKEAMKNHDNERRDTIRLLQSAVKQYEIDKQVEASDDIIIDILQKEAKKRRESIEELNQNDRPEQAAAEEAELVIIGSFLPEPLSEDELRRIIKAAVEQSGAQSVKEMGMVMGLVMPQVKGRADGKLINQITREFLG